MRNLEKTDNGKAQLDRRERGRFPAIGWILRVYSFWRNLSVRLKLYLMVSISLISFTVAMVYMVETGKSDINQLATVLYNVTIRSTSDLRDADKSVQQIMLEHKNDVYNGVTTHSESLSKSAKAVVAEVGSAKKELDNLGVLERIHDRNSSQTLEKLFAELNALLETWSADITKLSDALPSEETLDGQLAAIGTAFSQITSSLESYSKENIDAAEKEARRKERFGFVMLALVVAATLILASMTTIHIVSILKKVNRKLSSVTEGDLTVAPDSVYPLDDLGRLSQSVDTTVSDLRRIIADIASNASTTEKAMQAVVAGAQSATEKADQVVSNMNGMSTSIKDQSTGVTDTSRAVEEMALGINRIAGTTSQIADDSSTMHDSATHGLQSVSSLIDQMDEISDAIATLESVISALNRRSENMKQIVANISGFAEDTNLLSLNASIEAARAGEQGQGFLVVASEMRRLSDQSKQAAQEVSRILLETVDDISHAGDLMHRSVEETRLGHDSADEVYDVFRQILASIDLVKNQLHETSAVTEQLSASSEEVAATMGELTSAAASISARAQTVQAETKKQKEVLSEVSHSSLNLEQVVTEMRKSVDSFKL
ncbi:methyl-accepting chemotaxis protein [Paenibacillus sp. NFR01]|uniref:methyl-accepting chemotaxis protein n=1 Tax=Paenibacillus sp. NFR01 TaxID=1566279 RepID=UPI0008B57FB7|nr:methyl-accepting chemotaxis protein [Paenibacillus sp. NFR01]SET23590.1 methyl-accepting chemotaxis protein [Paenibacillus sp. NFR01]